MREKLRKKRGQSLIEIVFVLSLLTIVLTGLAASAIFALKSAQYSRNKSQATQIAKEALEELKGKKQEDSFWNNLASIFSGGAGTTCESFLPRGEFRYKVCYDSWEDLGGGKYRVAAEVTVWWGGVSEPAGNRRKVKIRTFLSNWEK